MTKDAFDRWWMMEEPAVARVDPGALLSFMRPPERLSSLKFLNKPLPVTIKRKGVLFYLYDPLCGWCYAVTPSIAPFACGWCRRDPTSNRTVL